MLGETDEWESVSIRDYDFNKVVMLNDHIIMNSEQMSFVKFEM